MLRIKIKIIDLLNKIANNEEVPEKVIFDGYIFEKDLETDYTCFVKSGEIKYLLNEVFLSQLNDEIEIIGEPKKIEKIKQLNNVAGCKELIELEDKQQINNHILKNKINELIDEINNLKEK